jgi:surface antigen
MLASSKNLSEFVDKEEYRTAVQKKIQIALVKIAELQKQLQNQKAAIDQLIASLRDQQSQLVATQNQQNQMLSYNQYQQDEFNQQIKTNKAALSQLYAKQAAIIAASFGSGIHYGGTGNYPYANAVCLNSDGCGGGSSSPYNWGYPPDHPYDEAGWQYRNCTSYAFWRLAQVSSITLTWASFPAVYNSGGKIKYSVLGNDFSRAGYRVDHDPNGDAVLAVNTDGNFGHIMYVEAVVNGQAVVSQYNAAGDGLYSTGTLSSSSSIWFVHIR